MKKIALVLLALTLLVCLGACGDNKPAEDNDTATTTTPTQATNGFEWEDDGVFNDAELSW